MLPRLLLLTCLLLISAVGIHFGQTADTLSPVPDEILLVGEGAKSKDPERAALLSAAFPGSGQIYNNKYWKLPIVYAGGAALGFGIHWNHVRYNDTRNALFAVRTGNTDPENPLHGLSEDTLERETNRFRRDRDFLIIGSLLSYFIVMVDAYVDAHLKNFPKEKTTSILLAPSLRQDFGIMNGGLTVSIKF
ncbi:MAG: hypothetical protein DHS20C17_33060 [Cyclobacteriaceae bacterium]|nr:MAG: hypothetical protein DHS20C17_33060 [Cyclobacteriaceae bacterium]